MGVQPQPVGLRGACGGKPHGGVGSCWGGRHAWTRAWHRRAWCWRPWAWPPCRVPIVPNNRRPPWSGSNAERGICPSFKREMPSFGSGCPEPRPTQPSALPVQWERTEGGLFLQRWAAARACWERRGEKVALLLGTAAPANRNPLPSQMSGGTPMAMWGGGDGA